jgi:hypothetical protein
MPPLSVWFAWYCYQYYFTEDTGAKLTLLGRRTRGIGQMCCEVVFGTSYRAHYFKIFPAKANYMLFSISVSVQFCITVWSIQANLGFCVTPLNYGLLEVA